MLPVLEAVQDLGLQTDLAAGVECVVPDERSKDDGDRKFDGLDPRFSSDDDEERGDKCGVAAREAASMEEMVERTLSALEGFECQFRALREHEHDERDEEEVASEEDLKILREHARGGNFNDTCVVAWFYGYMVRPPGQGRIGRAKRVQSNHVAMKP